MAVGGVGRGGGKGRAGGAKGAAGAAPAAGSSFGGKVDKAESLVGPSGLVGSSNVQGPKAADPVAAQAVAIARKLKDGGFKSKEEATKALVAEILKEKLRMKSDPLTEKISAALLDDPRLNEALKRLLPSKAK